MDNLTEIENNKAKIIDLLKKIDFSKNQIREHEQSIDYFEFKLKLSEKEHERSLNYIKEIEEGLHMDLDELLSNRDEYDEGDYAIRNLEIQTELDRNWKQTMKEEEEFIKNKEKLNRGREKFEILITNQQNNIDKWSAQISKLSTINKELNDSQSIQVKVTLNYEENIILEELVKMKGTNKSSVLRDMIKDYNDLINERDSLKSASDRQLFEMNKKFELQEQEKQSESQTKLNKLRLESSQKTTELKIKLEKLKIETEILQKSSEEKFRSMLQARDTTIEELRSMKSLLNKRMQLKGKELESFCENEFNKIRSLAFPKAFFERQKTIDSSKKADLIFRDFDESGNEILSIIFEFKEKKFDKSSIQQLDELRTKSKCDYAILISDYVQEGELENYGIIDLCHEYPKMFAVRSNYFLPMLSILKNVTADNKSFKKDNTIISEYIEPKNFDEIPSIIKTLQEGSMVIVNLTSIDTKERQRFSDMIFGATFGIKGTIKNIGNLTYVFTPENHLIKNTSIDKKDLGEDTQNYFSNSLPN